LSTNEGIIGKLEKTGFTFFLSDIALAMTMAHIAADAGDDSQKKIRNQENARRAYDTVLRLSNKTCLTDNERDELNGKLGELRSALEKLGEVF
jgi:hypothetical protein